MTTSFQEIAKSIKENGKQLLHSKGIDRTLSSVGQLFYTGSYALDLMTWNDIDIQLILNDDVKPIEAFLGIFNHIAKDPDFIESQMIHFHGSHKPKMPRGVYLGIQLNSPEFGGSWKLDIWALAKKDFEKNRILIEELSSKLDERKKNLILEMKHELMAGTDRVPQMGSHHLYQAILLEGIEDKDELFKYLSNQGIVIKK